MCLQFLYSFWASILLETAFQIANSKMAANLLRLQFLYSFWVSILVETAFQMASSKMVASLLCLQFLYSFWAITLLLLYYDYLKHLALKARQLRQACRPGGTLTQAVKQPYCVRCLTGHFFKRVIWDNVKNMKMMTRNVPLTWHIQILA